MSGPAAGRPSACVAGLRVLIDGGVSPRGLHDAKGRRFVQIFSVPAREFPDVCYHDLYKAKPEAEWLFNLNSKTCWIVQFLMVIVTYYLKRRSTQAMNGIRANPFVCQIQHYGPL
jgi:hypothetical protein